jgi:A/G-specific adenine glycosylase
MVSILRDAETAARLMAWYDAHARVMPWRVPPGSDARPDPYRIWLSEVMLQQTTVAAARGYFRRFTDRWPTVEALAAAADADVMAEWAGLGYYARARNLLACARAVAARGGFPDTADGLRALPGVGPYTAAAVAAIAFGRRAVVVDGNVERVVARLFAVETPLPRAKAELSRLADRLTPDLRPGDHAQAMMDLGATICTPRKPACTICPLTLDCAGRDIAATLPRKAKKAPAPVRQGTLWLARRPDGAWLVETRPARGLLGGMTGFPGDGWDGPGTAPVTAEWHRAGGIRHTFTHFQCHLDILVAQVPLDAAALRGNFRNLAPDDLPTLFRKAHDVASAALEPIES